MLAPPEYKALHPAGSAPTIQDGEVTLAESAACMEYICHKFGDGKLFVKPSAPNYADFLYWFHFANGSLQPGLSRGNMIKLSGVDVASNKILSLFQERTKATIKMVDARLKDNDYLAGDELTAADVMSMWSFTGMRFWYPYSLEEYPNVQRYVQRISQREAYKKAMSKAEPDLKLALDVEPPKPFFESS